MKRILVIDDDERVALTLKGFLEKYEDYRVITALDGKAGLRAARKEDPDLILLDINMPSMSGLEVLKRLNADTQSRFIPVIMLTGVDTEEAKDEAIYEYADQYIVKPCDMALLHSRIERILSLRAVIEKKP